MKPHYQDPWYWGRVVWGVARQATLQAAQLLVSRGRGRMSRALLGRRVPVLPQERAAAWLRAHGPDEPRLLWRFVRTSRRPHDSVESRASHLPPAGLAGAKARRILVFHEADRAGPHLEAYLEYEGTAYNIGVKRLSPAVLEDLGITRTHHRGEPNWLTQASCERLKAYWAQEFGLNQTRWLAQSTDHQPHEARMGWGRREDGVVGYGAGEMRQVLDECEVVFHTTGKSVEFHDPLIDRHRKAFVFKSMPKTEARPSNILGVGRKENPPRPDVPKPDLTMVQDLEVYRRRVGPGGTHTRKLDGASALFESGPKGTQSWSPRISKVTGAAIMYDHKIGSVVGLTTAERTLWGAEILTHSLRPDWWWLVALPTAFVNAFEQSRVAPLMTPWQHQVWITNSAAVTGGLLNSHRTIPDTIRVTVHPYVVAKVGRTWLVDEPYHDNYRRVVTLAQLHADLQAVPLVAEHDLAQIVQQAGVEGLVGVPAGASLLDGGYKLKIRGDGFDWVVERVELEPGENGGVAGVVWFRSLESGRLYKMGGGPLGPMDRRRDMLAHPEKYEGRVYEVASFEGHEGRAARIVREHPDKGVVG